MERVVKPVLATLALLASAACQSLSAPAQAVAPVVPVTRILIAGDSTAADYPPERKPFMGWGQALPFYVADGVSVLNLARNGRSTKSYIDEGRWDKLISQVAPGDLVMISFGHNDARKDAPERYAPAEGAYRDNLARFIADVQAAGARAVVLSPVARRLWEGPAIVETHGLYAASARKAAEAGHADFIDLAEISRAYFQTIGREETKADYVWYTRTDPETGEAMKVEDNTHFTALGACGVAYVIALQLEGMAGLSGLMDASSLADDPAPSQTGARPSPVLACNASR